MLKSLLPPALLAGAALAGAAAACELQISEAWIGEAPPAAPVRAAYATVRNPGGAPVTITSASSPGFGAVEIHEMAHVDGRMRMRPVAEVQVPANGRIEFEPGGLHFMLFRPSADLGPGIETTLELHACGSRFSADIAAGERGAASSNRHDHHH